MTANGANMPRCLQRGALFDFCISYSSWFLSFLRCVKSLFMCCNGIHYKISVCGSGRFFQADY